MKKLSVIHATKGMCEIGYRSYRIKSTNRPVIELTVGKETILLDTNNIKELMMGWLEIL